MDNRVHSINGIVDPAIRRVIDSSISGGLIASAESWSELESTNSRGLGWLGDRHDSIEALCPRLIIADQQTAGRGRQGRSWLALTDSLACSLIVWNSSELLPLAVGVAVAQAIESLVGIRAVGLKWPNDVWLEERKVSGILIERSGVHPLASVIGVGVNIRQTPVLGANDSRNQPTSILASTGRHLARAELLEELLAHLIEQSELALRSPADVLDNFRSRCRLTGHIVRLQSSAGEMTGRCTGVDDSGALIMQTENGEVRCRSGEVCSVRPG